ncbi:MAG: hypothetical protein OEM91_14385, partial [Hyphomicrobiales bacterium]|nr:hypothetical protein [Hyphomicrobiales bacterium]
AFMGLIFLAAATELPEAVTTITAAVQNEARLLLNNMFGGITLQTAILAVADAAVPAATLTFYPRKTTHALEGTLLMLLLAMLLAVAALGEANLVWNLGLGSVVLATAYIGCIVLLRNYEQDSVWTPVEVPEELEVPLGGRLARDLDVVPLAALMRWSAAMTAVILVCGVALVELAGVVADQTGLGASFIGVTLLAASTSLPELSTTVAAVRIGSFTMAISNIFGSNLIMVALLLPADLFYRQGVLLERIDPLATFALITGIVVTGIYVAGLLLRQKRRLFGMGIDSVVVLALYLASLVVFYQLR